MRGTKGLFAAVGAVLLIVGFMGWSSHAGAPGRLPALRDGDLVFQTSGSGQAAGIMAATGSAYTHMGIVRLRDGAEVVIEAVGPVKETPLSEFRSRGEGSRIAVYRYRSLSAATVATVIGSAERLAGRPYDPLFLFGNKGIYCSELAYVAFRDAGIELGRVEKLSDLHIDASAARALLAQRWRDHPACDGVDRLDACLPRILDQSLITPASIAADPALERIYSDW